MNIPAESITNCDTKKFFNKANLYFTITYTYIMITMCLSTSDRIVPTMWDLSLSDSVFFGDKFMLWLEISRSMI